MNLSTHDYRHTTHVPEAASTTGLSARQLRESTAPTQRILVVDDDCSFSSLLILYFTAKGYEVLTAHTGSEAIWLVSQGRFDLMILNQCLNGKDALPLLDLAKAKNPDIPVLVFMAADANPSLEEALTGRADGVFRKLGPLDLLSERVCQHLGAPDLSVELDPDEALKLAC